MIKHFINLTNGLEWAADLPEYSFVRIESTAIEKSDWTRVLRDLDANFLMNLALGNECHFYDCGTRRMTSKTVSVGVPFVRQWLHDVWIKGIAISAPDFSTQALKRKIGYFRRYLTTDTIRLIGHSRATTHDGDKSYYRVLAVGLN